MKRKIILLIFVVILISVLVADVSAAVTLAYFNAKTIDLKVILEWETSSEIDMLYFVILRSDTADGPYQQVGDFIITQGTPVSGLIYRYTDTDVNLNQTYYYRLEAVDNNYQSQFYGPIAITVLSATYTKTVTPSKTMTVTGTITPNTSTPTPTLNQTKTETLTLTPTSPFSFVTNTFTPTASFTSRFTPTMTRTPKTNTPEFTRTFEIIAHHTPTPRIEITPSLQPTIVASSIRSGVVGFGISIFIGVTILLVLIILKRTQRAN